jgi:hypothetical protein
VGSGTSGDEVSRALLQEQPHYGSLLESA